MKPHVLALALALPPVISAAAHDQWQNGEPVPQWVKDKCCGEDHAHHLLPQQVHVTSDGFRIDGYQFVVPFYKTLPAPDGEYWIFYTTDKDGVSYPPICFFGPFPGM